MAQHRLKIEFGAFLLRVVLKLVWQVKRVHTSSDQQFRIIIVKLVLNFHGQIMLVHSYKQGFVRLLCEVLLIETASEDRVILILR